MADFNLDFTKAVLWAVAKLYQEGIQDGALHLYREYPLTRDDLAMADTCDREVIERMLTMVPGTEKRGWK